MKAISNVKYFLILFITGLGVSFLPGSKAVQAEDKKISLGFCQVSPEGTWRLTNTNNIIETAKKEGIDLIYKVGANNKDNQIEEMRELIIQGVDVLAFSPSQVDGWDEILQEARDAGIPVIVLDRAIHVKDDSLYVSHIGSDMVEEGRRAGRWLVNYMKKKSGPDVAVKIVELKGIEGSTPAVHRQQGFAEIINQNPHFKIIHSESANFTLAKGKEIMAKFLDAEKGNIDAVFAHNDEMGLGAIDAIDESWLKYNKLPGKDIVLVSVDAIKKAFEAMIAGKLNCSIECSPLLGPQLMKAVKDLMAGKKIPKEIVTIENDYPAEVAEWELPNRTY